MRMIRPAIPILSFALSALTGYLMLLCQEIPIKKLVQDAANHDRPIVFTFTIENGVSLHSIDGKEVSFPAHWGASRMNTMPYILVGDQGKVSALSFSLYNEIQTWSADLPSPRMKPGKIVKYDKPVQDLDFVFANSAWLPLDKGNSIVLHNLQSDEERAFETHSTPPWLGDREDLWSLEVSPDATAAVACRDYWPQLRIQNLEVRPGRRPVESTDRRAKI